MEKKDLPLSERIRRLEEQGIVAPVKQEQDIELPVPIPLTENLAQKLLQEDRNNAR